VPPVDKLLLAAVHDRYSKKKEEGRRKKGNRTTF
jgi:hypothetical protein